MNDTIPSAVLVLLAASPWHRTERKPVQARVYFSEATDKGALFTFEEANRLLSEHAFHDQACGAFWPAPARVKVSSLAVCSLDSFLADTYRAWARHKSRLREISSLYGPVHPSPKEQAASRADWWEVSRPTQGEREFRL
jgi:hypothetical protein